MIACMARCVRSNTTAGITSLRGGRSIAALARLVFAWGVIGMPGLALAQDDEGPRKVIDARIEGLVEAPDKSQGVDLNKVDGGGALTWIAFVFVAVVAVGPMFKNARRSHLD